MAVLPVEDYSLTFIVKKRYSFASNQFAVELQDPYPMMDSKQKASTNCYGQVRKGGVDLPMEIMSDILSRLPIESILICQTVCKTWNSITQNRFFFNKLCNSHYRLNRLILKPLPGKDTHDNSSHLVLVDVEEQKTRRIPVEKMLLDLEIMSFCNGLLCLASGDKVDPVVIYNPITRKRVTLPSSGSKHALCNHTVGIGFDPLSGKYKVRALCNHTVGIGFDPLSGKYKVVKAYAYFATDGKKIWRFEIISLGESSWRELSAPPSTLSSVLGVSFWNGALYWKMMALDVSIFEFNLSSEKFSVIPLPENLTQPRAPLDVLDLGGCLTLAEHSSGQIKLWRLTRNGIGGDPSFCLQHVYDTHVGRGTAMDFAVISEESNDSYLLKVGFWNSQHQRHEHLTRYFPRSLQYSHLNLSGFPSRFYAICFKPSLISPLVASSYSQ